MLVEDDGVTGGGQANVTSPATVKTTMEVYARASYSADREAASLLQERFT
ncbi:MAG: hypothetical protein M0Z30_15740 [Actinomycetota bacterium]|nr:hypothetical protein [Actinomycetota bacterium]